MNSYGRKIKTQFQIRRFNPNPSMSYWNITPLQFGFREGQVKERAVVNLPYGLGRMAFGAKLPQVLFKASANDSSTFIDSKYDDLCGQLDIVSKNPKALSIRFSHAAAFSFTDDYCEQRGTLPIFMVDDDDDHQCIIVLRTPDRCSPTMWHYTRGRRELTYVIRLYIVVRIGTQEFTYRAESPRFIVHDDPSVFSDDDDDESDTILSGPDIGEKDVDMQWVATTQSDILVGDSQQHSSSCCLTCGSSWDELEKERCALRQEREKLRGLYEQLKIMFE